MIQPTIKTAIIIPAYNEEITLVRCIQSLSQQDYAGQVDVIIAANGCHDHTVINAKQAISQLPKTHFSYQIIDLKLASKTHALNQAEKRLDHTVYIYLDADIELSNNAVSEVVKTLSQTETHLCVAPTIETKQCQSKISEFYGRVWLTLPAAGTTVLGAGFVAVNKAGREKWQTFPDIIADDTFIISHFKITETRVIKNATFKITLPEGFYELIQVRTRWQAGFKQLQQIKSFNIQRNPKTGVIKLISEVGIFPVLAYASITLAAKINYLLNKKQLEKGWFKAERKTE